MRYIKMFGLMAALAMASAAHGQSVGTAFTYQGKLDSGAVAASGVFDFHFKLFDSISGGTQVGATQCLDNVNVAADGTFTVQIDFGATFGSGARFLEIEVRHDTGLNCANTTGFSLLTPRQAVKPAPVATHALHANALDAPDGAPASVVFVDNAGNVGIGTTTPAGPFDVRGPQNSYIRTDSSFGDLHFNGGTDGFFGMYNDGPLTGRTEFVSSNGVNLSVANNGYVGIGVLPVTGTRLKVAGWTESDDFRFATPQTVYISVDSASFTPVVGETVGDTGAGRYTSGTGPISAGVQLPQDMVVTQIVWYVRDISGNNLSLNFLKHNLPRDVGSQPVYINQIFTSGTPGVTAVSSPTLNHTVNNLNSTYYLIALPAISGNSWDSGRIGVQGAMIVGTVSKPR